MYTNRKSWIFLRIALCFNSTQSKYVHNLMCFIKQLTCGNIIYVSGWKVFTWTINILSQINFQFSNDIFSSTPFECIPIFQWYIYFSLLFLPCTEQDFPNFCCEKTSSILSKPSIMCRICHTNEENERWIFQYFPSFFSFHSIPFSTTA